MSLISVDENTESISLGRGRRVVEPEFGQPDDGNSRRLCVFFS